MSSYGGARASSVFFARMSIINGGNELRMRSERARDWFVTGFVTGFGNRLQLMLSPWPKLGLRGPNSEPRFHVFAPAGRPHRMGCRRQRVCMSASLNVSLHGDASQVLVHVFPLFRSLAAGAEDHVPAVPSLTSLEQKSDHQ